MIPSGAAISDLPVSGTQEWAALFGVQSKLAAALGGAESLYAATDYFVTGEADTPPLTPFLSTLRQTFTFERSLLSGTGFAGLSVALGRIEIDNTEALYDADISDYSVDGEDVTIKVGEVVDGRMDYSQAYTVGQFVAVRHVADESTLIIEIRDKTFRLDVSARKSNPYAGTGNLEGGPEVAGKNKPWALGWPKGVTAAPILPVELIDQVNDGECVITACYDDGAAYTLDGDVATLVALRAATVIPGHFLTCNAVGLARRGGAAFGTVTYDVKGYDGSGNFLETTAECLKHVILNACEVAASEIADHTFDLVEIQQPAARDYYFGYESDETVAQFANTWMAGVGGYCGVDRLGQFEIAILDVPGLVASGRYDETQFLDIKREPLPDGIFPPPQRVRVTYAHNWTPLNNVVGEVTDQERIAALKAPHQVAATSDEDAQAVLRDYPSATTPDPIQGFFRDDAEDDALAEAERQFDLLTGARALYRGTIPLHPFVHDLVENIHVTRPRFELTDGKIMRIVSVRDAIENRSQEIVGLV